MKDFKSWILIAIIVAGLGFYAFYLTRPPLALEVGNIIQEKKQTRGFSDPADGKVNVEDIKVGIGEEAKEGDLVSVNYIGTLADGTKFDDSYERGRPFEFLLGKGYVVKGFDIGVLGMKVGGKRKFAMHSTLGYGDRGVRGKVPPNSVLIFEVELLGIKKQ